MSINSEVWMSMETAPKGENVWILVDDVSTKSGIRIVHWIDGPNYYADEEWHIAMNPTVWRPLPELPIKGAN